MIEPISTSLATLALVVSATTMWLTILRRGTVRMTQPTTIFFGMDESKSADDPAPKVYLRTLLFATAKRGRVVESMYIELSRNQSRQIFPVWVLGEDRLARGSGIFVGENGLATNHHFLTLRDGANFQFAAGEYELTVFAKLLSVRTPKRLFTQRLEVSSQNAADIQKLNTGVYFDWVPIKSCYVAYSQTRRPGFGADETAELLRVMTTRLSQPVKSD